MLDHHRDSIARRINRRVAHEERMVPILPFAVFVLDHAALALRWFLRQQSRGGDAGDRWRASPNKVRGPSLAELARRTGRAVVQWHTKKGSKKDVKHQVRTRLHEQYLMLTHNEIWGSQTQDIVWRTFMLERDPPPGVGPPGFVHVD